MLTLLAATAYGQVKLPADIDPVSLSRLPVVKRDSMNEDGKRLYDFLAGGHGSSVDPTGPVPISLYSPGVAEPMHVLNQYLRKQGVLGNRLTELAILVVAREVDQQYEWAAHQPAAVRAGVEEKIIETIRDNKEPNGLGEKETVIIRFGRQLFREKKLSSETFAKARELFGSQGVVELAALMGDYAYTAILLNALDQHVPPERTARLPVK